MFFVLLGYVWVLVGERGEKGRRGFTSSSSMSWSLSFPFSSKLRWTSPPWVITSDKRSIMACLGLIGRNLEVRLWFEGGKALALLAEEPGLSCLLLECKD